MNDIHEPVKRIYVIAERVDARITGVRRQEAPPKMEFVEYEIIVDTDENDRFWPESEVNHSLLQCQL